VVKLFKDIQFNGPWCQTTADQTLVPNKHTKPTPKPFKKD
ncbi:uncharacterized protein METZ01_LOCUS505961, partial [marine metagenome]